MQHAHGPTTTTTTREPFWSSLFSADFMPRAQCIQDQSVIWLHVASDAVIALAYFSIPVALTFFVMRRRDIAFGGMFLLFAAFILACGTTHVFDVLAVWHPMYRLDGVIKALTAVISAITAAALWFLIPAALRIPSPAQLREANDALAQEITVRKQAQAELCTAYASLEERVRERTADLQRANDALLQENRQRHMAEVRQRLVMAELDHRVKNNMATIVSLAELSASRAENTQEFLASFTRRLHGLARLHETLAVGKWAGASLREIAIRSVLPFRGDAIDRVTINGPDVVVPARMAMPVSMVLNELATNAVKYGALSTPQGHVTITLRSEPQDVDRPTPTIHMEWLESGGPPVTPPAQHGFGSQLIQSIVPYELKGVAHIEYDPQGVRCRLSWPMPLQPPNVPEHQTFDHGVVK